MGNLRPLNPGRRIPKTVGRPIHKGLSTVNSGAKFTKLPKPTKVYKFNPDRASETQKLNETVKDLTSKLEEVNEKVDNIEPSKETVIIKEVIKEPEKPKENPKPQKVEKPKANYTPVRTNIPDVIIGGKIEKEEVEESNDDYNIEEVDWGLS